MYVPVLLKFIDYWYQERVLQRLKNKFCKMAVCFHELFCENFIVLMKREALAKKNSPWDKISPHCAPPAFGSCWLAWQLSLVGWLAQCASALPRTTDTQWKHKIKEIWKFGPMWQAQHASALPKSFGSWELIYGRAVKTISSSGVRSPCALLY